MDGKKITQQKIDEVLEAASQIDEVKVPPFFKDKVLHRLTNAQDEVETVPILGWFTLKYQVAALLIFAIVNILAIRSYVSSNQEEQATTFAQMYGLSSQNQESILN